MNDKSIIAPYLAFSLSNLFKLGNKRQFRLLKYLKSPKMTDVLKHGSIPVTLYTKMLTLEIVINLLNSMGIY